MIASVDWAHTKPLNFYLENENYEVIFKDIITFIGEHHIDTIIGENIPSKLLLVLLEHNIKVFRCAPTLTAEYRRQNGFKKESDSLDAKYIFDAYGIYPEMFYEYTEDDKKFLRAKHLYKLRESIQKTRIQYEFKLNAYKNFYMFDDDIIEKISSVHKELFKKEEYIDKKLENNYFRKYIKLFDDIVGMGGVTVAHIISEIGNINRFKNEKSFLNYAFGYKGYNHNHRLKTRLLMSVDIMFTHKNEFYTNLYHNYKEQLQKKHPVKINESGKIKYNPAHLTRLAKRRVAREIAKLIYKRLQEYSPINDGIPLVSNKEHKVMYIANIIEA